jgi:hypothetical protein
MSLENQILKLRQKFSPDSIKFYIFDIDNKDQINSVNEYTIKQLGFSLDDKYSLNIERNKEILITGPLYCQYNNEAIRFMNLAGIHGVDSIKIRLETISEKIRSETYNPVIFAELACLLQSLAETDLSFYGKDEKGIDLDKRHKKEDPTYGKYSTNVEVDSKFYEVISPREIYNSGFYQSRYFKKALFSQENVSIYFQTDKHPLFVLHTDEANNPSGYNQIINESIVGLFALNNLREEFPTFQYIYTSLIDIPSIVNFKSKVLFGHEKNEDGNNKNFGRITHYNLVETLINTKTLSDFLDELYLSFAVYRESTPDLETAVTINSIIAQVFLAIAIAHERYDFSHNDLSMTNIMVDTLDEERTIRFGNIFLKTKYVARIINFTKSHVIIKREGYEPIYTGINNLEAGESFLGSSNFRDVVSLVISLCRRTRVIEKGGNFGEIIFDNDKIGAGWVEIFLEHDTTLEDLVAIDQSTPFYLFRDLDVWDYVTKVMNSLKSEGKIHFVSLKGATESDLSVKFTELQAYPPLLSCEYSECHSIGIKHKRPKDVVAREKGNLSKRRDAFNQYRYMSSG